MSYVGEPYAHDVFFSYAHARRRGERSSALKEWSLAFARRLLQELRYHAEFRELTLFLDEEIDQTSDLKSQLETQVTKSALLAVLLSEDYLDSEWCRLEREWWHDTQRQNTLSSDKRVHVVRVQHTARSWKDLTGEELIGFPFFDEHLSNEAARPWGWPKLESPSPQLDEAIRKLAARINENLRDFKAAIEMRRRRVEEQRKLSTLDEVALYVYGHGDAWEYAADQLSSEGFIVLPDEPHAAETPVIHGAGTERLAQHTTQSRLRLQEVERCDALVLVATDPDTFGHTLLAVGRDDRRLVQARTGRSMPCAVLDSAGLSNERRLRNAKNLGVAWIDRASPFWMDAVRSWLEASARRIEATAP